MTATLLTAAAAHAAPSEPPVIEVLSNRADLVSGGDALVEVKLPAGVDARDATVKLDGRDITHDFRHTSTGRFVGLVSGLREGDNELTAHLSKNVGATITLTNHSKQGPVIAGKQLLPWICETEDSGLGPSNSPDCVAPTRYDYFYKSKVTGQVEPYDVKSPPPDAAIATTTTDQGKTVPYIVRRELGVINRGIYEILALHEPGEDWTPWKQSRAWNGKLHWFFIGGWGPWHHQSRGAPNTEVHTANNVGNRDGSGSVKIAEFALSRGFAVATTTLTRANNLLGAESVSMINEHIIETYGPVRYTTSSGCSGGSASQHEIANRYPGLLDGILPTCSIPDVWSITPQGLDCVLLSQYFDKKSPQLWLNPSDRTAVTGTEAGISCKAWGVESPTGWNLINSGFFDPGFGCTTSETSGGSEPDWVYSSETNPDGVRCTLQEVQAAALGHREPDGFANRPWDNVGIQYGLAALRAGDITPEQFVDLNSSIGAFDIDYKWMPKRVEADAEGLRNLYRSGLVNDGSYLDNVPIIDYRKGMAEEIHEAIYTRMMRKRLIASNGHADNHVIWKHADSPEDVALRAFSVLDEWLAAIEADRSGDSLEKKVVRHKPALARDTCWAAGMPDACEFPEYPNTRMVAGGPVAHDIFKCQLKPIDWNDYGSAVFTPEQKQQLQEAFPDGVCDWAKPGVGQQPMNGPWQTFMDRVGGEPMGPAPQSVPISGGGKGRS